MLAYVVANACSVFWFGFGIALPVGVHSIQVVATEPLVLYEAQSLVERQRATVRHLCLQYHLVASFLFHRVNSALDQLRA